MKGQLFHELPNESFIYFVHSYYCEVGNETIAKSDYINEFRVDHSKKLIRDPEFKNYTVVSMGLESGFNSKSTFYSAFKKFTNMTPVEFRNSIEKN